jgi:hypothetical protein
MREQCVTTLKVDFGKRLICDIDERGVCEYQRKRKVAGAGNRTVNYGIGTLSGILKKYRLWSPIADGVLRESHNVGCAISAEDERRYASCRLCSHRAIPYGNAHIAPRGLAALVAFQFGIPSSKTGRLRVH